ncbi:MAG: flagellar biosynthesis protein FlhB [Thermoguttaceae bacterium]|jgi:flagellar biosynthetic protein FlhB
MAEFDGEKSQEPTPHRRQQAREEGHVARSQDLASSVILLLGLAALLLFGGGVAEMLGRLFTEQLGGTPWLTTDPDLAVARCNRILFEVGRHLLPLMGLLVLAAVGANVLQFGFLMLPDKLVPDLSRLNPLQGLQRIFSLSSVVRLGFGLVKVVLVAAVAYACLAGQWQKMFAMTELPVPQIAVWLVQLLLWTSLRIAGALLALAVLDYGFQWWKNQRDLRMTPQEIREEMKHLEGNPQVLARRRQAHRQLAMHRLADIVPKADVVITNPTELAVAIQYEPKTMAAPIVAAKGAGVIARRIRELALKHGVPILEKKPLARALYREVEIDHPIPQDKYAAVAEVLAYVYQLKGKKIPTPRG